LLTGTIGVGKTSLAERISEVLHARGLRHGLLDLDWLGQVYPPLRPEEPFDLSLSLENLGAVVSNFRARGIERFVIAATITSAKELSALRAALPGVHLTVGLVIAPAASIRRRIERRDTGRLRDDFLARTIPLAEAIAGAGMEDIVIENPDGSLEAASAQALEYLHWH
jgi:hypothetical protein